MFESQEKHESSVLSIAARNIRKSLIEMVTDSKSSHIGTCLSIVDALVVLYFRILTIDPKNPLHSNRDKFILSKAHGSAALYACLAERGYFDKSLLKKYYIDGGILPGHLDRLAASGVETSGGSLGHGLSLGLGMAIANQIDENPGRIYVLVGDGELNEGSVWEAIMLAPNLKLANLTVLVDYNKIQSYGRTDEIINQKNMSERWRSFGWETHEINGHDFEAIDQALNASQMGPKVIVMHSIKGKGVSFMEDKLEWHYRSPNAQEYAMAMDELQIEELKFEATLPVKPKMEKLK